MIQTLYILIVIALFIFSCDNDYIAEKRKGLRPYKDREDSKQAQESNE